MAGRAVVDARNLLDRGALAARRASTYEGIGALTVARVVVTGGAGFLGSHLCERCSTAATRSSPSTTWSPGASPTSSTCSAGAASRSSSTT